MPIDESILNHADPSLYDVRTKAPGPRGSLPLTPDMLLHRPSGDLFGLTQNAGMGWNPARLTGKQAHAARTGRSQHVEKRHTIGGQHPLLEAEKALKGFSFGLHFI